MVTTFYPPYNFGGDGIFVRELALSLTKIGHEVRVIHCEDAYQIRGGSSGLGLPERYNDNGIEVCRLKNSLGALSPILTQQLGHPVLKTLQLRKLLDDDFDVVNFHNISLVGGPSILGLGNIPAKLYTLHDHWLVCATHIFWKNRQKRCDSRQCLRCCVRSGIPPQIWRYTRRIQQALKEIDVLIAPSQFTADQHLRLYPGVPTRVVPLFSRIQPQRESLQDRQTGRPTFVYTGRITASKGLDSVLAQFTRQPDYDLILAGTGDALADLRNRYSGYPNISFPGQLEEKSLIALYSDAVALLLPSLAPETFGLSVVEAMACGTPAIVRDSGGCAEIIEKTGAGFVYNQPDEIQGILHRLVSDHELRKKMSVLARSGYEKYYTRQRYLDDYLATVSEIRESKTTGSRQMTDSNRKAGAV